MKISEPNYSYCLSQTLYHKLWVFLFQSDAFGWFGKERCWLSRMLCQMAPSPWLHFANQHRLTVWKNLNPKRDQTLSSFSADAVNVCIIPFEKLIGICTLGRAGSFRPYSWFWMILMHRVPICECIFLLWQIQTLFVRVSSPITTHAFAWPLFTWWVLIFLRIVLFKFTLDFELNWLWFSCSQLVWCCMNSFLRMSCESTRSVPQKGCFN